MFHHKNDGSGWAKAVACRGRITQRCVLDGIYYYNQSNPLPVISASVFDRTGNVLDATVGWTSVFAVPDPTSDANAAWLFSGELVYPGLVEEDGLSMACIWVA